MSSVLSLRTGESAPAASLKYAPFGKQSGELGLNPRRAVQYLEKCIPSFSVEDERAPVFEGFRRGCKTGVQQKLAHRFVHLGGGHLKRVFDSGGNPDVNPLRF